MAVPNAKSLRTRLTSLAKALAANSVKTAWAVFITVILTAALVTFVVPAIFGRQATMSEELAKVRHVAASRGLYPVFERRVDLGAGDESYVIVLRAKSTVLNTVTASTSDDIRIYNIAGTALHLAFNYQPDPFNDGYEIHGFPYLYEVIEVTDVAGGGHSDLLGTFSVQTGTGVFEPFPTVITWDDNTQRFVIAPLLAQPPALEHVSRPGIATINRDKPLVLKSGGSSPLQGYTVDAFGVLHRPDEPPLVVGGFLAKARDAADPELYQAIAWTLNLTLSTPETYQCGRPAFVRFSTHAALSQRLIRGWIGENGVAACGLN